MELNPDSVVGFRVVDATRGTASSSVKWEK